ncbi:MAG: S-layer homology domain-containing protein, partial [Nitriliruptorales bacterium]
FGGGGGGGGGGGAAPAPTTPASGSASGKVAPGGTLSTDPSGSGATPESPVQTKITSPVAGTVDVTAGSTSAAAPSGWRLIDHEVTITAPAATPDEPLVFEFHLDGSVDASGVTVFRNGAAVGGCLGASAADPDPCVRARSSNGDDTVVTVLTSRASRWNFGFAATACPDVRVAASSFRDLGSSPHARSVECIAWWGAASGISTTAFAPTNTVTRAQMATFVARALEAADVDLPGGADRFGDVGSSPHGASIDALAAAGIVSGVGGDRYDPGGSVTRAQMATFLIRAARYATGEALVASTDAFADDDGSPHEPSIDAVKAFGLASGTGTATFSPDRHVSREQMATFLVNLLDLLVDRGLARPPA